MPQAATHPLARGPAHALQALPPTTPARPAPPPRPPKATSWKGRPARRDHRDYGATVASVAASLRADCADNGAPRFLRQREEATKAPPGPFTTRPFLSNGSASAKSATSGQVPLKGAGLYPRDRKAEAPRRFPSVGGAPHHREAAAAGAGEGIERLPCLRGRSRRATGQGPNRGGTCGPVWAEAEAGPGGGGTLCGER